MASSKVQGVVHFIGELEYFGSGDKQVAKRIVVLEVADGKNGEYINHIPVEWLGDKAEAVGNLDLGQIVEIDFNIRGREYRTPEGTYRYFVSLAGWKWDVKIGSGAAGVPAPQGRPSPYDRPAGAAPGGPTRRPADEGIRQSLERSPIQGTTDDDEIPW